MKLVNEINKYIFREYDIRGVYPETINEEIAYTVGKSYGSYIQKLGKKKCIIGYDIRHSSPILSENLIKGILETGVDVVSLGLVTTPMYYYAAIKMNIPSGIMITASHNPKDDNGFKIAFDERGNARGEMIQEFYEFTVKGNFVDGKGQLQTYDIKEEYISLMHESINLGNRKVKVVLDPGNATTTVIAKELFETFNIDVHYIYEQPDADFPNHHPDPCVEENLTELKKQVKELKADIGIGFDGDGDRLGIVDEKGNYIPSDKYMIMIIRDIIDKVEKKKFLYDVKCSKALDDEIKKLGGEAICYRVGNSYTKAAVTDFDLPFGGEYSGHVYFRDKFLGFDSAIYAALRIIEILSYTDQKTSDLLTGINEYFTTEEMKFASLDEKKHKVIEKVKEYVISKNYEYLDIDGIKVIFEDGFALVRVSNTGPNVTARFEANTKERLVEIEKEFVSLINLYNN